jgi:hypothetical protein
VRVLGQDRRTAEGLDYLARSLDTVPPQVWTEQQRSTGTELAERLAPAGRHLLGESLGTWSGALGAGGGSRAEVGAIPPDYPAKVSRGYSRGVSLEGPNGMRGEVAPCQTVRYCI